MDGVGVGSPYPCGLVSERTQKLRVEEGQGQALFSPCHQRRSIREDPASCLLRLLRLWLRPRAPENCKKDQGTRLYSCLFLSSTFLTNVAQATGQGLQPDVFYSCWRNRLASLYVRTTMNRPLLPFSQLQAVTVLGSPKLSYVLVARKMHGMWDNIEMDQGPILHNFRGADHWLLAMLERIVSRALFFEQ